MSTKREKELSKITNNLIRDYLEDNPGATELEAKEALLHAVDIMQEYMKKGKKDIGIAYIKEVHKFVLQIPAEAGEEIEALNGATILYDTREDE